VSGSADAWAYGKVGTLTITVTPANAAGTVTVTNDKGEFLGNATITGGAGTLALPVKSLKPGTHTVTLNYLGNSTHKASSGTATVEVTKATPKVVVKTDKTIKKGDKAKVVVKVTADDSVPVRGRVKLVIKGTDQEYVVKVEDGKAVFKLSAFTKTGDYTLRVRYLGTPLLEKVTKKLDITVKK
jgi:hypothetical protein